MKPKQSLLILLLLSANIFTKAGTLATNMYLTTNTVITPAEAPVPLQTYNCDHTILTRANPPTGFTYFWQGSSSTTKDATNSNTTYDVTVPGTYYIRSRENANTSNWSDPTAVSVTVKYTPAVPTSTDVTIYDPGTATLNATTTTTGATIKWYDGTTLKADGETYAVAITTTKTFNTKSYINACYSAARNVIANVVPVSLTLSGAPSGGETSIVIGGVSCKNENVNADNNSFNFTIACNTSWNITNIPAWVQIAVQNQSGVTGTKSIAIGYSSNFNAASSRQGHFSIKTGNRTTDVYITQQTVQLTGAFSANSYLEQNTTIGSTEYNGYTILGKEGTMSLAVSSNASWTAEVTEGNSWLGSITPSSSNGNGTVSIHYAQTTESTVREGKIALKYLGQVVNEFVIYQLTNLFPLRENVIASNDKNYIYTLTPQIAIGENELYQVLEYDSYRKLYDISNFKDNIQYFDGLGRSLQDIDIAAAPDMKDIVNLHVYDAMGREAIKYLPFNTKTSQVTGTSHTGSYVDNALSLRSTFYQPLYGSNEAAKTSTQTLYDFSPLNRVTEQSAPGSAWQITGNGYWDNLNNSPTNPYLAHTTKMNYKMNDSSIYSWIYENSIKTPIVYVKNTLYVTETMDENWQQGQNGHIMREFKDKSGKVILKDIQQDDGSCLKTQYLYDNLQRLTCVIPPKATSPDDADLCFYYQYDNKGRTIQKKIPGADWVYMAYDKRDRLAASQNGNQRLKTHKEWTFIKYDALNRPVMTGILVTDETLSTVQSDLDNGSLGITDINETRGNDLEGYTNHSFPVQTLKSAGETTITSADLLTVTYYDDYTHMSINGFATLSFDNSNDIDNYSDNDGTGNGYYDFVKGLTTGIKVKVLNGNEFTTSAIWICNVIYYDDYLRVIQTVKSLYDFDQGKESLSTKYDFAGKILQTRVYQTAYTGGSPKVDKYFTYDHAGRLIKTEQEIIGDVGNSKVTLNEMSYNSLGQLVTKKLHTGAIQTIDYTYNIRGWLTSINDPDNLGSDLFAMRLLYNDASPLNCLAYTKNLFNGNISGMIWKRQENNDPTPLKSKSAYGFKYDAINRLTDSYYAKGETLVKSERFREYNIAYDPNGNIATLNRKDSLGKLIDSLAYTYESDNRNRLQSIADKASKTEGFINLQNQSAEYSYDANGNLLKDLNKGYGTIQYNVLNLPKFVSKADNDNITYIYDAL